MVTYSLNSFSVNRVEAASRFREISFGSHNIFDPVPEPGLGGAHPLMSNN